MQRAIIAWCDWLRDGRTFANSALGYPTSTVEYSLMRGLTGGCSVSGSRVPSYFKNDREVEQLDRAFWRFPDRIKETFLVVFYHRKTERDAAVILGVTRHQVRSRLSDGYSLAFQAIQPANCSFLQVSACK